MRVFIALIITVLAASAAFPQQGPLTQAEYVKMLYTLQKDPAERERIIEALRKRGIAFEVTDGLRGFTRTKAGADEELRRALDEAGRRHLDPQGSQLPSAEESRDLLEKARRNTMAAVGDMPDFVVKQLIQRGAAFSGTNTYRTLDRLVVGVSYRSTGEEDYRLLSINGVLQTDPKPQSSYSQAGGTSSTGEFVTVLSTIFKPENEAKFEVLDTDRIDMRKTVIYEFDVARDKARQRVSAGTLSTDQAITGMHGKVWIDRDTARVLRIESQATELPPGFIVTAARRTIDYSWVTINDEKYLLPARSEVTLTSRSDGKLFDTRNIIRFKDYQKYGTDVVISDEDVKDEPAPQ
ncbi:MAG: hypothetical protein UZ17_ACD001002569 [Acidobacteria bacterium OLB17]|nr:MAG: hypothetical protein UZ17_ACD001002569 [Acidobacteria bacterium OLB17]MCZ2390382.1 hypothetical protein [Acidobacteriota bacterium]